MISRSRALPFLLIALSTALVPARGFSQMRSSAPPPGDFWQTCRNISVYGNGYDSMMTGQCQDRYGRWQSTGLRFAGCSFVSNFNGQLSCGRREAWQDQRPNDRHEARERRPVVSRSTLSLFSGPDFTGAPLDTNREYSNLPRAVNDRAMSLRIQGRGAWQVCADSDFRGNCQVFETDVPDLRRFGLGEAISSVRPVR